MKTDEQGNFVYDFPFLLGAVHTYHGEPIQKMENKRKLKKPQQHQGKQREHQAKPKKSKEN